MNGSGAMSTPAASTAKFSTARPPASTTKLTRPATAAVSKLTAADSSKVWAKRRRAWRSNNAKVARALKPAQIAGAATGPTRATKVNATRPNIGTISATVTPSSAVPTTGSRQAHSSASAKPTTNAASPNTADTTTNSRCASPSASRKASRGSRLGRPLASSISIRPAALVP